MARERDVAEQILARERVERGAVAAVGKRIECEADGATVTAVAPMMFIPAVVTGAARAVVRLPGGVELEGAAGALPADWVAALARALVKG